MKVTGWVEIRLAIPVTTEVTPDASGTVTAESAQSSLVEQAIRVVESALTFAKISVESGSPGPGVGVQATVLGSMNLVTPSTLIDMSAVITRPRAAATPPVVNIRKK